MSDRSSKRAKYGAVPTEVDGVRFASKREAKRYWELKMLQKAGEISDLELQPKFPIYVAKVGQRVERAEKPVCVYVADFRYRSGPQGVLVIEDVKGVRTPIYKLKKRMVERQYDIRIAEI